LVELQYETEAINAFSICFGELVSNAFTHGLKGDKDGFVQIVSDVSRVYVSTTLFNADNSPVNITDWISKGVSHLVETNKKKRGRGLLTCYRRSDVLEPFSENGVKAIVYRNRVRITEVPPPTSLVRTGVNLPVLLIVTAGHSNPSFGRRIVERLKNLGGRPVVLLLDPAELYPLPKNPMVRSAIREALEMVGLQLPEPTPKRPRPLHYSDHETSRVSVILEYSEKFYPRGALRIVCNNEDIIDLMPDDLISRTVDAACQVLVGNSIELGSPDNSNDVSSGESDENGHL
jgi:anti-sigma regulatory factor (Ser/Thr protein kinase)